VPTKSRKPPIHPVRWTPPPIDPLPDLPAADITVVSVPGDGPEDVVVDADGQLWTGLIDGRIVRLSPDGGEQTVVANTGGRPLGLHVARDGRLLICDSYRGLLALHPESGELTSLVEAIDGRALKFCSNVTETSDGTVYFTESTSAFHFDHFLGAVLEARGRGGLFRLATDGTVTTLVDGLYFANGLTATVDGSALVFAETMGCDGDRGESAGRGIDVEGAVDTPADLAASGTSSAEDRTRDLGRGLRRGHRCRGRRHSKQAARLRGRHRRRRISGPSVDVDNRIPEPRVLRALTSVAAERAAVAKIRPIFRPHRTLDERRSDKPHKPHSSLW
jgi:hypothetical protein